MTQNGNLKDKLQHLYVRLDYEVVLPLLARMPNKVGRYGAKLRGILYFYLKRDWRSFTFGDFELWDNTYKSFREMFPQLGDREIVHLVKERYIYQSYEEFETAKILNRTYSKVPLEYVGKEWVEEYLLEKPNAIFATCHFGSLVGQTNLQIFGKSMLHMGSSVTKQDCVHPSIREFYAKKYLIGNEYMNGGEIVDVEGNSKRFLKFVRQGGSLSAIADLPAPNVDKDAYWVNWFGKQRALAEGIHHISERNAVKIIGYVCYYQKGKYILKFAKPEENMYEFFENEIKNRPGMWWAADLLSIYKTR